MRTLNVLCLLTGPLLTGLLLTGCTCDPATEDFTVDDTLTEEDIDELLDWQGTQDTSELACEAACIYSYESDTGWYLSSIRSCELNLTRTSGTIQCTGDGIEYYCK